MQAALHFQLSSTRTKNIPLGVLLTLANPRSLSSSFLLFSVSLLLKDPPELHSAKLLTFCSSFVFVPFVSVTEREMEFRREECEGMFVCQRRVGGLG